MSQPSPRSDARRNRERLIDAARAAYASAAGAAPSLEAIARSAGVGIGTLYRHFPTREALVEAVYSAELDEVIASAGSFRDRPADAGLRAWMDRYAQFFATKRGMVEVLRAGWASGAVAAPTTRARVREVVGGFLARGAEEGVLRDDVDADDATSALVGVLLASSSPEQAATLLDLLLDGLRVRLR